MTDNDAMRSAQHTFDLKKMTDARVSLGRFGSGQPTKVALQFLLDHARAREAVWATVDQEDLGGQLADQGIRTMRVDSLAGERSVYVRRPDLGRVLSQQSIDLLQTEALAAPAPDVVIVVADGLSSSAVTLNAVPLILALVPQLENLGLSIGPVVLATQARVAIADPIGECLAARLSILLIGERPGLSAADSLGAYITYGPRTGNADSNRNCISNIRDGGLAIKAATNAISQLVREISNSAISGVALKTATPSLLDGAMQDVAMLPDRQRDQ